MKFQISKEDLKKGFVNVTFVGDEEIKELNKKYRNKDYATDVLSFDIHEKTEEGKYYIGDVVVNIDQAERQASEYGNNLEQEVSELAGHGILHLLGVHHEHDDE
jgi:probable rRNA maturation factor